MGLLQSNNTIKANDTYLSESFNKGNFLRKKDTFLVQYIDLKMNVNKINKATELYNLILPCFISLADIKKAGVVHEFFRNDTNFKYSAQDFNIRNALLFLKNNEDKLNIKITKIQMNGETLYQSDINNDNKEKEIDMLKNENRILKRNLNLSNKYMHQSRLQSAILLGELINKTYKLKKSDLLEENEEEEEI